ncbi:hypothetical protein [Actinoplanes sp. G11-F43]|uniref:hypothetical protein n=1 Tax=Actinoplanes sp. G11-F43 TaxID=3424130 RepID=UPI003D328D62
MTDEMVVVQWTDADGLGFSRKGQGGAEYWTAAERLLNTDLAQPPGPILDTGGHPVWTLRHVPVGRRTTWCFVVQGRRGEAGLGVAGTCRFAFAPDGMDAAGAWRSGITATGMTAVAHGVPAREISARVREVLRALDSRYERIAIDLEPAGAAAVIAGVLGSVPEAEARARSWSTCTLLLAPGRARQPAVSGAWPEQFRAWAPQLAATVAASFDTPSTVPTDYEPEPVAPPVAEPTPVPDDPADLVVAEWDQHRAVTDRIRAAFAADPDPLMLLADVCPRLTARIPPRVFADLLRLAGLPRRLRTGGTAAVESVAESLVRTGRERDGEAVAEDWLREVTRIVGPGTRTGACVYTGGRRALDTPPAPAGPPAASPAGPPAASLAGPPAGPSAGPPAGPPAEDDTSLPKMLKLSGLVLVATTLVVTLPIMVVARVSGDQPDPAAFHTTAPDLVHVIDLPATPAGPAADELAVRRELEERRIVTVTVLAEIDQGERGRLLQARMAALVPPGTEIRRIQGVDTAQPAVKGHIQVIVVYAG